MKPLTLREQATRDFLKKIDDALVDLFTPKYTDLGNGHKEQNNKYSSLNPGERNDVIIEACSLLIASVSAEVMVKYPKMDQLGAMAAISRKIKELTEIYHKQFLAQKEAEAKLAKETHEDSKRTQG